MASATCGAAVHASASGNCLSFRTWKEDCHERLVLDRSCHLLMQQELAAKMRPHRIHCFDFEMIQPGTKIMDLDELKML